MASPPPFGPPGLLGAGESDPPAPPALVSAPSTPAPPSGVSAASASRGPSTPAPPSFVAAASASRTPSTPAPPSVVAAASASRTPSTPAPPSVVAAASASRGPSTPPPPRVPAQEAVPAAEVDEQQVVVVVPAAAASWYKDRLYMGLLGLTGAIMSFLFVHDMGTDPTAWWGKFADMTVRELLTAVFLTVGDIASLGLIFSPSGYFRRMYTEGAAELAPLASPLAALVNCAVWLVYGMVVDGKNMSVIVVNAIGATFNIGYATVYYYRSGYRRDYTRILIILAVVIAVLIGATNKLLLIDIFGWKAPNAVGFSGTITASLMYGFGAYMSMATTQQTRGVGGFSSQAIASAANSFVWLMYAGFQKDFSMMCSNGMGILCFLVQAVQLIFFKFKKAPAGEEEPHDVHQRLLGEDP